MDIRVKNTEVALDKTNTEVKEVTQSHKMLQKEVDNIKKLLDMRQDVDQQKPENLGAEITKGQVSQLSNHVTANSSADETHKLCVQNLQRENEDLKKCIEDIKAYYAQSNEQKLNKELHSKNKMLKQENYVLHQELNKILSDSSATDTRRELIRSKEKIIQLEHELEILKGNVAVQKKKKTEKDLLDFKKQYEELEKDNINLTEENERLTTELNNSQQYVNRNPKMSITCILDEKQELMAKVEKYKEKTINLKMRYETLEQEKSNIDYVLEIVTNEKETLEIREKQLSLKNEKAYDLIKDISAKNLDLENDIIISKKKLKNSYSELEQMRTELMTERNLSKHLDSEQQALKHIIEQTNQEKQEINRKNFEKQHALERQIQILEKKNRDLKENISKLNLELEQQTKEAQENQNYGQQPRAFDKQPSISLEDQCDAESRSRENPEVSICFPTNLDARMYVCLNVIITQDTKITKS